MKRVGILGTGSIARWHARCWARMTGAELVGYYDIDQAAAEAFARDFGGRAFGSLDAFFDAVELVDVCTPGTVHKQNVLACAAAGKAVACEKPLARHVADCQEMIDACEQADVPLFVAQVVRFFPQFVAAKAAIDSGEIGKPGVIRTERNGSFPGGPGNTYYGNFAKSGGVILDVAIHDIDFQRWCCGEVERVFARGLTFADVPNCDHTLITLRFESGAVGHIESSWAHPRGQFRTRLEISGDQGLIEWDSADRQAMQTALTADDGEVTRAGSSPAAPDDDPYYLELAHFLDHVENGTPLRVTPHDGLMAVKVSLAAIESVRTGKVVAVAGFTE